ncbi:MAG TPA: hypothetical protein VEN81_11180 [Planctomycetota bacterium]|nr:hypothetical protein [Planctomycetota bacterium]
MRLWIGLLVAIPCLQEDPAQSLRAAIQRTAGEGYAYQVKGKFDRAGEWIPAGVLTSRIKLYQSVRYGEAILVKGPEGLWRTPDERIGEKVKKGADPEAEPIVRLLEETEPPHKILERALEQATRVLEPENHEVNGVLCRRYLVPLKKEPLQEFLQAHLDKAVKNGTLERPDEIHWAFLRGTVAVYVSSAEGTLRKIKDERSVEIAYKVPDASPRTKKYKLEWDFEFTQSGQAKLTLPKEVKERLKIPEE